LKNGSTEKNSADDDFEVLDLGTFAQKMKVCENTIRNWIKKGKLLEGEDFFRPDRDYRFPWSLWHLERLMKRLAPVPPLKRPPMVTRRPNRTRLKFSP
jgi:hypothetical protein